MREKLKEQNNHLEEMTQHIEKRKKLTAEAGKIIKNKMAEPVNESEGYSNLLKSNENLQKQLDTLLSIQSQLHEQTKIVKKKIEDEKNNPNNTDELRLRDALESLKKQYYSRVFHEASDSDIIAELEKQIWVREACLTHLRHESRKVKETIDRERDSTHELEKQFHELARQNSNIVRLISEASKHHMHFVNKNYRYLSGYSG